MAVIGLREALRMKGKDKSHVDMTWIKAGLQGKFDEIERVLGDYKSIEGMWKNEPAFVLGCSQGLKNAMNDGLRFSMLNDFHTIGCNHLVEDYPNLDYLIFQDKRFIDWTTFDLKKFKGILLTHVKLGMQANEKILNYFTQENGPSEKMIDGLFSYMATGLLALNFAIITGADPIYCIGIDNGGIQHDKKGTHYKKDYPHEVRNHPNWPKKYKNSVPELCKKFNKFHNRIYNVDPLGDIKIFKQIKFSDIKIFSKKQRENTICHVGTLPIDKMGTITRHLYSKSTGNHIYSLIGDPLPKANTYILECFRNRHNEFINFKKPVGSKVISLVHSSGRCMPAKCSDEVVTLTEYSKYQLLINHNIKSVVIPGAIETKRINVDYSSKNFGRITRNASGKFHVDWNKFVQNVLSKVNGSKCRMAVDNAEGLIKNNQVEYVTDIKINNADKKRDFYNSLSVAVFAHGDFEEVFPMAVLEAMACGLPIIALRQHSMCEMIGNSQIICDTIEELEKELIKLLPDAKRKKELGRKAQIRAEHFSIANMINKWNEIL